MDPLMMLVSIVVLAACAIVHPSRAQCPPGWHVGTLKPSGRFECTDTAAAGVCDTKAGCDSSERDPSFIGRIYCSGGAVPITNSNGRAVGCQRVAQ